MMHLTWLHCRGLTVDLLLMFKQRVRGAGHMSADACGADACGGDACGADACGADAHAPALHILCLTAQLAACCIMLRRELLLSCCCDITAAVAAAAAGAVSMIKVEQYKISGIDTSWTKAAAAARSAGHFDVAHKLEALIGLKPVPGMEATILQRYLQLTAGPGGGGGHLAAAGIVSPGRSFTAAGGVTAGGVAGASAAAAAAASPSDRKSVGLAMTCAVIDDVKKVVSSMSFVPDLALKEELHSIKVTFHMKLLSMSLPVPSPADVDEAVRAGVVLASRTSAGAIRLPAAAAGTAAVGGGVGQAGGVRLFGLPDPTGGSVPEGCVAVRPDLVPLGGRAVIYRDPGIHPGDVRRVRVIPYPPALQQLLTGMLSGAMFLPCVGSSCLAASLAGGDYDGEAIRVQHYGAV